MQVDVHHIEAHVARTAGTQHWVKVCSIVVHQATAVVNQLRNFRDTRLEEPEGIGIGHHHGCNLSALFCDDALQVIIINGTVCKRLYFDDFKAADSCRGWICAMCAIWYNNLLALHVATRTIASAPFTVSAGCWGCRFWN